MVQNILKKMRCLLLLLCLLGISGKGFAGAKAIPIIIKATQYVFVNAPEIKAGMTAAIAIAMTSEKSEVVPSKTLETTGTIISTSNDEVKFATDNGNIYVVKGTYIYSGPDSSKHPFLGAISPEKPKDKMASGYKASISNPSGSKPYTPAKTKPENPPETKIPKATPNEIIDTSHMTTSTINDNTGIDPAPIPECVKKNVENRKKEEDLLRSSKSDLFEKMVNQERPVPQVSKEAQKGNIELAKNAQTLNDRINECNKKNGTAVSPKDVKGIIWEMMQEEAERQKQKEILLEQQKAEKEAKIFQDTIQKEASIFTNKCNELLKDLSNTENKVKKNGIPTSLDFSTHGLPPDKVLDLVRKKAKDHTDLIYELDFDGDGKYKFTVHKNSGAIPKNHEYSGLILKNDGDGHLSPIDGSPDNNKAKTGIQGEVPENKIPPLQQEEPIEKPFKQDPTKEKIFKQQEMREQNNLKKERDIKFYSPQLNIAKGAINLANIIQNNSDGFKHAANYAAESVIDFFSSLFKKEQPYTPPQEKPCDLSPQEKEKEEAEKNINIHDFKVKNSQPETTSADSLQLPFLDQSQPELAKAPLYGENFDKLSGYYATYAAMIFNQNPSSGHKQLINDLNNRKVFEELLLSGRTTIDLLRQQEKNYSGSANVTKDEIKDIFPPDVSQEGIIINDELNKKISDEFKNGKKDHIVLILKEKDQWFSVLVRKNKETSQPEIIIADSSGQNRRDSEQIKNLFKTFVPEKASIIEQEEKKQKEREIIKQNLKDQLLLLKKNQEEQQQKKGIKRKNDEDEDDPSKRRKKNDDNKGNNEDPNEDENINVEKGGVGEGDKDKKDGNLFSQSKTELLKSKSSFEKLILEHKEKLNNYIKNPDAFDNKGLLKNITSEIRQKIIEGRVKALEKQIQKQQGELDKINNILNKEINKL